MPDERLFHITTLDEWARSGRAGYHTRSTRGLDLDQVGFIHCSFAHQVSRVAEALYGDVSETLVVLEIDPDALVRHGLVVRVEAADPSSPDAEKFPHLYGALPAAAVVGVRSAGFDDEGGFIVGDAIPAEL